MPNLKSFQQRKFARIQGVAHLKRMDLSDSSNSDRAHVSGTFHDRVTTEEDCNSNEIQETIRPMEISKDYIKHKSMSR